MNTAHVIWFTGLSRSGKTALAELLASHIRSSGQEVEILDGKLIRDELTGFFGYSKEERLKVSRVLCVMARHLTRHDVTSIVTAITPYQESRDYNRSECTSYIEIYVDCPIDVCMERDESGLYKKAMQGDLKHFIGVDDPYEVPKNHDMRVLTATESLEESSRKVNTFIDERLNISLKK